MRTFPSLLASIAVASAVNAHAASADRPTIHLVVRYDDLRPCQQSEIDRRVVAASLRKHLPLTIGVIPFSESGEPARSDCVDRALIDAVRQNHLEVALHGHSHLVRAQTRDRRSSEFVGRALDEQTRLIADGQRVLEELFEVPVETFIPPWNTYDQLTVRALQTLGFRTLSAHSVDAGWDGSLAAVPVTVELNDLRAAIERTRARATSDATIVTLFHEFAFVEADTMRGWMNAEQFEALWSWLADQKDVRVLTAADAVRADASLTGEHQRQVARLNAAGGLLPAFLRMPAANYPTTDEIRGETIGVVGRLLTFVVIVAASVFVASWRVLLLVPRQSLLFWLPALLSAALVVYAFKDMFFHLYRELAVIASLGILAGWAAAWRSSSASAPAGVK